MSKKKSFRDEEKLKILFQPKKELLSSRYAVNRTKIKDKIISNGGIEIWRAMNIKR